MTGTDVSDIPASRVDADGDGLLHTDAATPPAIPPAIDHLPEPRTPDANHPTTGPDPLPSGAGPAPADGVQVPQVTECPSFVRHCPSSTNRDAYKQKTGRQLAPLLIDESGMGARFHLLDNEIFSAHISGAAPSDADRKKFKTPKLKKGMLERDIYPQLGAVIQSVLKAAKCTKLRFLDTANHKSKDGNHGKTETFNDAGIYRSDTGLALAATDLDPKILAKSKMSPAELEERLLGARSWFWMDVPIEIKGDEKNSAFYFKSKPKGSWDESEAPACVDEKPPEAEGQEGGGQEVEVVEEPTQAKEGEDEEMRDEADGGRGDEHQEERGVEDGGYDFGDDSGRFEGVEHEVEGGDKDKQREDGKHPTTPAIIKRHVPPFIKLSDNGEQALAQFVEYHLNVFKYQHRTFCYSIYICFDMARLLFFDRAGAYVSHPFSWVEPTSLLHEFVWKFAQLANANNLGAMGHDTTATLVSPGDRRKFINEAKKASLFHHVRAGLKEASEDGCPLYELVVQDVPPSRDEWFPDEPFPEPPTPPSTAPTVRRFIVGRPHFSAEALVGRCTRGYMAFDVTDPKKWVPCFLKDSWRPFVPHRTRPEHLVYERFKRRKVTERIATMICGGDVGGFRAQRTEVQNDLPDTNKPVLRIHYRLVTKEIGLPLWEFDNFSELSAIFVDALRGHRKAWDLAGVLHRDISVGNIMILTHEDRTRSGFLIDWDLSRLQCELGKGPVEPDRTGTWQFRSALSLRYPRKPYRRSDDIESFIHAYIYLLEIETVFEGASRVGGIKIGGTHKIKMLRRGDLGFEIVGNIYLQQLLNDILLHCKTTYENRSLPSRAEVSPANSAASFDQGTHSYDLPPATPRTKRTRAYEEDEDIVDDEGESSDWPRRSKRLKSRKGKGASRAR
ncbi:hypothetical protein GSI_12449 [Ganoderma sinense ZZ0214-1]|uniref:Fungal-type protein kinase domain-containing protein n=1 Tax=Ganoderma sinense ZZ0214-1 TaxID=1077348 RepID=A0A2G8RSS3_9APHY|nr:hypothetical protein GSI_12449 [Ganoderma sinense ZZ0214-1]